MGLTLAYGFARITPKGVPNQAAEMREEDVPQGLKPDVFSIICGPTKVVP